MQRRLNCVLLIDDDEPTNFLSRMLIEEANCTQHIQVVQSGQDALSYIKNSERFTGKNKNLPTPDLIFLDINMPAMNGWEFLAKYAELEKRQKDKIIMVMLTTSLDPDDEVKAKNIAEVTDFRRKPLTKKMVDEILETYFAGEVPEN
ncbi:MAG: response regulator [Bacteroidota bacterium]